MDNDAEYGSRRARFEEAKLHVSGLATQAEWTAKRVGFFYPQEIEKFTSLLVEVRQIKKSLEKYNPGEKTRSCRDFSSET